MKTYHLVAVSIICMATVVAREQRDVLQNRLTGVWDNTETRVALELEQMSSNARKLRQVNALQEESGSGEVGDNGRSSDPDAFPAIITPAEARALIQDYVVGSELGQSISWIRNGLDEVMGEGGVRRAPRGLRVGSTSSGFFRIGNWTVDGRQNVIRRESIGGIGHYELELRYSWRDSGYVIVADHIQYVGRFRTPTVDEVTPRIQVSDWERIVGKFVAETGDNAANAIIEGGRRSAVRSEPVATADNLDVVIHNGWWIYPSWGEASITYQTRILTCRFVRQNDTYIIAEHVVDQLRTGRRSGD